MACDKQVAGHYEKNREISFLPSAQSFLWGSWVMTVEVVDLYEGVQKRPEGDTTKATAAIGNPNQELLDEVINP